MQQILLLLEIFPTTCLIRTYTFIYFWGKIPTYMIIPRYILAEIANYKNILSSFKLLFCRLKHFKVASKS